MPVLPHRAAGACDSSMQAPPCWRQRCARRPCYAARALPSVALCARPCSNLALWPHVGGQPRSGSRRRLYCNKCCHGGSSASARCCPPTGGSWQAPRGRERSEGRCAYLALQHCVLHGKEMPVQECLPFVACRPCITWAGSVDASECTKRGCLQECSNFTRRLGHAVLQYIRFPQLPSGHIIPPQEPNLLAECPNPALPCPHLTLLGAPSTDGPRHTPCISNRVAGPWASCAAGISAVESTLGEGAAAMAAPLYELLASIGYINDRQVAGLGASMKGMQRSSGSVLALFA